MLNTDEMENTTLFAASVFELVNMTSLLSGNASGSDVDVTSLKVCVEM